MKIAIPENLAGWSTRWIQYCEEHGIEFKTINCYQNDIIEQLKSYDGLMWHWSDDNYRNQHFTRQLIHSLEMIGIRVYPNSDTCWHYNDKVGQKYMLEAIGAPLIPTYVFYDKKEALEWIESTTFPKVFKLSVGAGASNVMLVNSSGQAKRLTNKAFATGFPSSSKLSSIKQLLWELRRDRDSKAVKNLIKGMGGLVLNRRRLDLLPRQKGYVYFQDFIPDNKFDDRILVVGNRAMTARRYVRTNDFRASGSGVIERDKELSNLQAVEIAFNVTKALKAQSVAFDFMYDSKNTPWLIEVSYAFPTHGFDECPGYWDENLNWHDEPVNPQIFIIEDFINHIQEHQAGR